MPRLQESIPAGYACNHAQAARPRVHLHRNAARVGLWTASCDCVRVHTMQKRGRNATRIHTVFLHFPSTYDVEMGADAAALVAALAAALVAWVAYRVVVPKDKPATVPADGDASHSHTVPPDSSC